MCDRDLVSGSGPRDSFSKDETFFCLEIIPLQKWLIIRRRFSLKTCRQIGQKKKIRGQNDTTDEEQERGRLHPNPKIESAAMAQITGGILNFSPHALLLKTKRISSEK